MIIKPADVKQVILARDDFGHEMRVGHTLTSRAKTVSLMGAGITIGAVEHGGTYTDAIMGKPRQFDYRCRISRSESGGIEKRALLAVECKNLGKSSPLVVCGRPRSDEEAYHTFIESRYDKASDKPSWVTKKSATGWRFYQIDDFVGKSYRRLKESKGKLADGDRPHQDDIYDGWSQALASSVELAESALWFAKISERQCILSVVLPVVVVPNESLWTATYDATGSIPTDPTPVDECEYFVGRKIAIAAWFVLTHIHFVTLKGFADLLNGFLCDQRKWDGLFPQFSSEIGYLPP